MSRFLKVIFRIVIGSKSKAMIIVCQQISDLFFLKKIPLNLPTFWQQVMSFKNGITAR